ncbi:hypothetical protein ACGFK1_28845 [Mycobacterium sp. NPDC048908]|uniref:hypothetical protein n=1 Tax=Mycobacterium sp. NPDC048908 TaxID=3364292 RepID=UPI003713E96D
MVNGFGWDLFESVNVAIQDAIDEGHCRQDVPFSALHGTSKNEIGQPLDADESAGEYMIDTFVRREALAAIETVGSEHLLERFTHSSQCDAVPAEQTSCDIGHVDVGNLSHPADIVDPHDLQSWFEQIDQPG